MKGELELYFKEVKSKILNDVLIIRPGMYMHNYLLIEVGFFIKKQITIKFFFNYSGLMY